MQVMSATLNLHTAATYVAAGAFYIVILFGPWVPRGGLVLVGVLPAQQSMYNLLAFLTAAAQVAMHTAG
jgi:hypothetical protein